MGFSYYKYLYFTTFTIYRKRFLLHSDRRKEIIYDAFKFYTINNWVKIYAFVLMSNHIHIIWYLMEQTNPKKLTHSFQSYTAKSIKADLSPTELRLHTVEKHDRFIQIWKKSPMWVELNSPSFMDQKLDYIHRNPMDAGFDTRYAHSSELDYYLGESRFDWLTLWKG